MTPVEFDISPVGTAIMGAIGDAFPVIAAVVGSIMALGLLISLIRRFAR